jgi:hypothetical protein
MVHKKTVNFTVVSFQQTIDGYVIPIPTKIFDGPVYPEKNDMINTLINYFYPYGKNKQGRVLLKENPVSSNSLKRFVFLKNITDIDRLRKLKTEFVKLRNRVRCEKSSMAVPNGSRCGNIRITTSQLKYIDDNILPYIRIQIKLL